MLASRRFARIDETKAHPSRNPGGSAAWPARVRSCSSRRLPPDWSKGRDAWSQLTQEDDGRAPGAGVRGKSAVFTWPSAELRCILSVTGFRRAWPWG
jgi:hypothetical protein